MEEIVDLPIREIDTSSIQQQMARNKELLQVKLMVRRPISQLIEQGILPPLRQSPVLYEQTKRLERARTEDYLQHKISNRPNRQQLIEHHILEDTNISPRLIARQQQLKKAKLADNLNERLSHRPGPLELIKGNILLPSNLQIGQAVKQGTIDFKPTFLGESLRHPQPSFLILKKDQQQQPAPDASNSSMGKANAAHNQKNCCMKSCNNYHFDQHCNTSLVKPNGGGLVDNNHTGLIEALGGGRSVGSESGNGVVSVNKAAELDEDEETDDSSHTSCGSSFSLNDNDESCSAGGASNLAGEDATMVEDVAMADASGEPDGSCQSQAATNPLGQHRFSTESSPGDLLSCKSNKPLPLFSNCPPLNGHPARSLPANKSKKNKIKLQSKNKIIKFHEYKGPPNAIKQSPFSPFNDCSRTETAYELLLQQQQLYLQLELEMQQKLTNQQLANQRLQQQQNSSKASLPAASLLAAKRESKQIEEASLNAVNGKEPAVACTKEVVSSASVSIAGEPKAANPEDQQPQQSIISTSMVQTSMINSSPVTSSKTTRTNSPPSAAKADPQPASATSPPTADSIDRNKIEEMKVNDLKQELKRYNLPISGSKNTLIVRLKNHLLSSKSAVPGESLEALKMEVDSPAAAPAQTTFSPTTYTGTQTGNPLTSSAVTTFATLTTAAEQATSVGQLQAGAGNLLGATAFLTSAQSSSLLNGLKPPPHLLKAQTSLSSAKQSAVDSLKSPPKPMPVQRRISEPQLQHIQLHFTNSPFQFATAQSPLAPLGTAAAAAGATAQQIHFLSTPALNTNANDLHLITQPLLNNQHRIITLQPTNSFPQLFFYPTQLAKSESASLATLQFSPQLNLNGPAAEEPAASLQPANEQANKSLAPSDSPAVPVVASAPATNQKTKKTSKSSKSKTNNKEKNKDTKTSESNGRKTSISASISLGSTKSSSLNSVNSNSLSNNLSNLNNNNCPPKSGATIKPTNYAGNGILEKKNETNYPPIEQQPALSQASQASQTSQSASGSYLMNTSMMNSVGFHLSNLSDLSNLNSLASFAGLNDNLIIDKPPPNYEEHMEATKNSQNNLIVSSEQAAPDYSLSARANHSNVSSINFSAAPYPAVSSYSSASQPLSYERTASSTNLISSLSIGSCSNGACSGTSSTNALTAGKPAALVQSARSALPAFSNAGEKLVESSGSCGSLARDPHKYSYSTGCNAINFGASCQSFDNDLIDDATGFAAGIPMASLENNHHSTTSLNGMQSAMPNAMQSAMPNGMSNAIQNTTKGPAVNHDFSLDFDLLMEDLTDFPDFDCGGNYVSSPGKSNAAMEVDKTPADRPLTINTDFSDQFTTNSISLHTPTLSDPPFDSSTAFDPSTNSMSSMIDQHPFTSTHQPTFVGPFTSDPFPSYSHIL